MKPKSRIFFEVESSKGDHFYTVRNMEDGWHCNCPYGVWGRRKPCRHIKIAERRLKARIKYQEKRIKK